MKHGLARLIIPVVTLALLPACASSNKATKAQVTPAPAVQASKAVPADTKKEARAVQTAPARNTSGEAIVTLKDVHFDFDRYAIRPADVEILKREYPWFKANPGTRVRIEGNCDERGTIEYNLALGQKRADATKTFLMTIGVPANVLTTISYGKERPIDPGHDEDAWAKNRRAHLAPEGQ